MLLVALTILVTMGRPIFFNQVRPGLSGQPFAMIKFRSMYDAFDAQGAPLPDDQRLGGSAACSGLLASMSFRSCLTSCAAT